MAKQVEDETNDSNIISKLFFLKSLTIFKLGLHKDVEKSDVCKLFPYSKSRKLGDKLEEKWNEMKSREERLSIVKLLWRCFGTTFILFGIVQAIVDIFLSILVQPYVIGKIVSFFTPHQTQLSKNDALIYVAVLFSVIAFKACYDNNFALMMAGFGIRIRTALCSFLYRKILKVSPSHLDDLSGGKVLTLITKDVQAFEMFSIVGNSLWVCILKVVMASGILYARVGYSSLIGIGCFIFVMPLQSFLGKKVKAMKLSMCQETDERLQTIQETVSGIRLIKMYTWEQFFGDKISACRKKEMNAALKMFVIKFVMLTVGPLSSEFALFSTLMIYIKLGNNISADTIYYITFIFKYLMPLFASEFPDVMYKTSEALSATKRFEMSLQKLELETNETINFNKNSPVVSVNNISVSIQNKVVLKNVTVNLQTGLTIITGPVGSGKSTFLKTVLNDYRLDEGNLTVEGSISYTSQEPWLFPASIKDNILFGQEYNPRRYQEVLRVCALSYDIDLLKNGDATIVEDRGANLSKGQQARVNLARAVYKDSDIYLLDDPLAGLDANVAALVFEECVKNFLHNKIVVLVTHNLNFLNEATDVISFENGTLSSSNDFEIVREDKCLDEEKSSQVNDDDTEEVIDESAALIDSQHQKMYEEKKKSGKVDIKTYTSYAKFGGGLGLAFLVFLTQGTVALVMNWKEIFIGNWVNSEERILSSPNSTESDIQQQHEEVLITYSLFIGALFFTCIIRSTSVVIFSRRASIKIHKKMIYKIVRAYTQFFDNNFLGNILNRFSKDVATVDEIIPFVFLRFFRGIFILMASVIMLTIVNKLFLIPTATLFFLLFLCAKYTVKTTTSLKRIEIITRSPVVGHINATLEGLTTIQAFKAEETVIRNFDHYQDVYASTSYGFQSTSKAFIFILDASTACFIITIMLRFFIVDDGMEAGFVGLAIVYAIFITVGLRMLLVDWAELENQMTSTERMLEYTKLEEEGAQGIEMEKWPNEGKILFEDISLLYPNSSKRVLNNINLTIQPGEKIGIVGRTGAGKSSLISAIFRMYDIEGKILIDDVDIKTVTLTHLRSKVSIIPQEPIVFSGSIRDNLDPLKKKSDEDIWAAIEKVNLKRHVASLDLQIGSNTLNFSVGEKQLLCIARAILQKNKIVVLDEATASTDAETEEKIYQTIDENFSRCTVITIAHKLQTVLMSDRVVVLDKGAILECEKPAVLLKDKNSVFYKMVAKAKLLEEENE